MSYIGRPTETDDPRLCRLAHTSAVEAIARLEARLAAGARFGVLASEAERLCAHDMHLLEGWHRSASERMLALCAGWATLVPGAAIRPSLLARPAPGAPSGPASRSFPDAIEALAWLRRRLQEDG